MKHALLALGLIVAPLPAVASDPALETRVRTVLAEVGPGTRFGLVVTADDGSELVAIAPDDRFMPASNTKMFTTAAAFATLPGIDAPDAIGGAAVRIDGDTVVLEGHGDARLSSAADCVVDCLAMLADAVAARTRKVRDVIGDATAFPDDRWSPGMSWNNIPTRSGTGIAALTLDDNETALTVSPGTAGAPPLTSPGYYTIDNRAVTVAGGTTDLDYARLPNSRTLRITGTIAAGAAPQVIRVGIDDPALYAAWRFKALLAERGVRVEGEVRSAYRYSPTVPIAPTPLARLTPPPLAEDLRVTSKVSQNLHAELLLRRIGAVAGSGSIADGQKAVSAMLDRAGVPHTAYAFSDGSGMSTYNRVSPRGSVTFLRWVAIQPWGAAWRATLPIGGVDGTLARRFKATPLVGRLFAKTGSLNATNALAGYMTAASGRTLTFAIYANDVPEGVGATAVMDKVLLLIAAAN